MSQCKDALLNLQHINIGFGHLEILPSMRKDVINCNNAMSMIWVNEKRLC